MAEGEEEEMAASSVESLATSPENVPRVEAGKAGEGGGEWL